jgi:hypothetical protein
MADILQTISDYKAALLLDDVELTRQEHQDDIFNIVRANDPSGNYNDQYRTFEACMLRILIEHSASIMEQLQTLNSMETPEQRTPEWYAQRLKLISASDGYYACKNRATLYYKKLVLKKLGYEDYCSFADAMIHGTMYEIVSQRLYETRYGVRIREYGCITHPTYPFIGASPDGIVNSVDDPTNIRQVSRIGRMLEIKNPYSRVINHDIKPEYFAQIQQQLEVCNLQLCDFLETTISSCIRTKKTYSREATVVPIYNTFADFLADSLTPDGVEPQNPGIPLGNHARNGNERGVLLQFKNAGTSGRSHLAVLYPVEKPYVAEEIMEWKRQTVAEMATRDFQLEITHYWKLTVFDVKTVSRDVDMWRSTILPGLTSFWNDVEHFKKQTPEELVVSFANILELHPTAGLQLIKKRGWVDSTPGDSPPSATGAAAPVYRFSDEV